MSPEPIREKLARLQGAAEHGVGAGPAAVSSGAEDDRWIIVATSRDGWYIDVCDQVLRGKELSTKFESAGGRVLLVKRSDFSAATNALEADKRRLWSKPGGMAGTMVTVSFLAVVASVVIGMWVAIGGQPYGPLTIGITVGGLGFLGLLSLARLASR